MFEDKKLLDKAINKYKNEIEELNKAIEECQYCANRKIDKILGLAEIYEKDAEQILTDKQEYERLVLWLEELRNYREKYVL